MSISESQKESQRKYLEGRQIVIRVPHSLKVAISEHTAETGESENAFLIRAIRETMSKEDVPLLERKEQVAIRLPKEINRDEINDFAKTHYGTTSAFIVNAVTETIRNDVSNK